MFSHLKELYWNLTSEIRNKVNSRRINDNELFTLVKRELFTVLVGDILDKLGFLHQFLPQQVKPQITGYQAK